MLSRNQSIEKALRVFTVAKYFLENPNSTIADVSKATGIPKSSVQRYLND